MTTAPAQARVDSRIHGDEEAIRRSYRLCSGVSLLVACTDRTHRSVVLFPSARPADKTGVHRDAAPVIAAQALIAHGMTDQAVLAYVRTWRLDPVDARAAVAAAHTLAGHDHGVRIARPSER